MLSIIHLLYFNVFMFVTYYIILVLLCYISMLNAYDYLISF